MSETNSRLAGKVIFIVGKEQCARPYTDKIVQQGARVVFTNNIGEIDVGKIVAETAALIQGPDKPDAILLFHPETSKPAQTFQSGSPIMTLVEQTRALGIPTLAIEHPRIESLGGVIQSDKAIARGISGIFQMVGTAAIPDQIPGYLAYMINHNLRSPAGAGRGAA